ncbi:MAG: hypothetical protein QNJ19_09005 [Woeseiaceae bacterium]|nr:hypothetical protein [Woeseiaceae bacterium]
MHALTAAGLLTLGVGVAAADEPGEEPTAPATDIEEITVVGDETVPRLRGKLRRLDQAFFSLYNELNSNDELDMICKRETRIGSQIPRTVCQSRRHRELQSERAQDVFEEDGAYFSVSQSWRSKHYKEVRDNVTRMLAESVELTKMMEDRAALRRRIETLKQEQANE